MSKKGPPKTVDVSYSELQKFIEIAESKESICKQLMRYIFKDDVKIGEDTLVNICELFALSISVRKFLQEIIKQSASVAKDKIDIKKITFRVDASHVLTISTIMINIVSICESLARQNYSVEVH